MVLSEVRDADDGKRGKKRMEIRVFDDYEALSDAGAELLCTLLKEKPDAVLGLATGSTPEGVYARLVARYRAGEISFASVRTVNLDEYYPIAKNDPESYHTFMRQHLFDLVDIKPENTHLPDGETDDPTREAASYEALVASLGYPDLQLLGIGRNGHVGFNEPANELTDETHLTPLTKSTLDANGRFFAGRQMPDHALTMGIGTILHARRIVLLANGEEKREALRTLRAGKMTARCPASLLLPHPDFTVLCDRAAYGE